MRILYLTQWFDPEPNIVKGPDFVRALEIAGYDVTVVTGFPNYPTGKIYPGYKLRMYQRESLGGVSVKRLPLYPSHSRSSLGRAMNFLSFFLSALVYISLRGGRYDLVYVYHPPITVGLAAAIVGRIRRLPFILDIQDLWPDTVLESEMSGTARMSVILDKVCGFVYRHSSAIIVQSQGIKSILIQRNVPEEKLSVVHNWADESALLKPVKIWQATSTEKPFLFLYGGNLGRMQALGHLIEAAKLGAELGGNFELIILGDGVEASALRQLKARIQAHNVTFLPRVSRLEARDMFAAADVLVLNLANKGLLAATVPSKMQFYLACGKPILAGVKGETADILNQSGAAEVVEPENIELMAQAMKRMSAISPKDLIIMGENGREYYKNNLSFSFGITKTINIIQDVMRN